MELPLAYRVDYQALLVRAVPATLEGVCAYLSEELPYAWMEAYARMTPRQTNISRIQLGTFEYVFDDLATLEAIGEITVSMTAESRLVGVLGRSAPRPRARDDARLRGFLGRTETLFGTKWDKGHYMAHELGGAVDGMELNVFVQRRDLNRGWSADGKVYRSMERYCQLHAGTFCFARPIYGDETARPNLLEFGILESTAEFWIELFDNT